MKKIILISCLSTLTLAYSMGLQAKIYKWTDTKGVVHYSATPPSLKKTTKQKVKNIENKIRFAAGKSSTEKKNISNNEPENKADKVNNQNENSELAGPDKKLVDYCKAQRNNLKSLKNNFRNVWIDKSGKRTNLNQKQRKEKVDYLKSRIEKDCREVETG